VFHVIKEQFKWTFSFSQIKTTSQISCRDAFYCCCNKRTHAWRRPM